MTVGTAKVKACKVGHRGLTDKSVDLHSRRQGTGDRIPEDKNHVKKRKKSKSRQSNLGNLIPLRAKRVGEFRVHSAGHPLKRGGT